MADSGEGERTECLPSHVLKLPSEDWRWNIFLQDLAARISKDELEILKNYVSGERGLGLRILEKIDTPRELFKILKQRMIVSKDNLITLQSMLWHINNKELHRKAVEYAMNVGNTLYFYPASDTPENGYEHVKFHVQGRDFSKIRRSDLEQLRTIVSQLLVIPAQFVLISGLEPSSSFIITFMIPEYYVSVLAEIISKKNIHDLTELGIDAVYIDNKKFSLSGAEELEALQSQEGQNVIKIFERLQFAEKQLEQMDIEYLELSRELEASRHALKQEVQNKQNVGDFMGALYQLHVFQSNLLEPLKAEAPSLKIQSTLANLRFSLRKVKDLNYDTDVIMNLMQAHSYLVDIRVRAELISLMKYMMTDIEKQKAVIISQQHTIQLLQFVSGRTQHEALSFLSQLRNTFQQLAAEPVGVNIPLPVIHILKRCSRLLQTREIKKLQKFHNWSSEEKCVLEKNPDIFLEQLVLKECQSSGSSINLANFLPTLLEKVERKDLAMMFLNDIIRLENERRNQSNDATAHGIQPQSSALNEQQRSQQLDEMNTRLKDVQSMIKELIVNKEESPSFLKNFMNPTRMPHWGSDIPFYMKDQREAELPKPAF